MNKKQLEKLEEIRTKRKAIIKDYVENCPEPDPDLCQKIRLYTKGKNRALGEYYKIYDPLTGVVTFEKKKEYVIHQESFFDKEAKYLRFANDIDWTPYVKFVNYDDENCFVEFSTVEMSRYPIDKKVNEDIRKYMFVNDVSYRLGRAFCFIDDACLYNRNGNVVRPDRQGTFYNKYGADYFHNYFFNFHDAALEQLYGAGIIENTDYHWAYLEQWYKKLNRDLTKRAKEILNSGFTSIDVSKYENNNIRCSAEKYGYTIHSGMLIYQKNEDESFELAKLNRKNSHEIYKLVRDKVASGIPVESISFTEEEFNRVKPLMNNPPIMYFGTDGSHATMIYEPGLGNYNTAKDSMFLNRGWSSDIDFINQEEAIKDPIWGGFFKEVLKNCEKDKKYLTHRFIKSIVDFLPHKYMVQMVKDGNYTLAKFFSCATQFFVHKLDEGAAESTDYKSYLGLQDCMIDYIKEEFKDFPSYVDRFALILSMYTKAERLALPEKDWDIFKKYHKALKDGNFSALRSYSWNMEAISKKDLVECFNYWKTNGRFK